MDTNFLKLDTYNFKNSTPVSKKLHSFLCYIEMYFTISTTPKNDLIFDLVSNCCKLPSQTDHVRFSVSHSEDFYGYCRLFFCLVED